MRQVTFTFDGFADFPGLTDGSKWNGFDNIWITPETRDRIVVAFRELLGEDANDIASLPVEGGLVSLANGYATQVI